MTVPTPPPTVGISPAWYVHFQESPENAEELLGKQLLEVQSINRPRNQQLTTTKLAKHRSGSNLRGGEVTARDVTIADLAGE